MADMTLAFPDKPLTAAYAYRWNEPSRPMLNIYHYRKRYGMDNPQFGVENFEHKKSNQPGEPRGTLGKLSVEVLYKVFLKLDIFGLEMVRELNAYFKSVLDGLYEFRVLKQHASETFRIMHAVEVNPTWNLSQIFAEFTRSRCRTCDSFGPYIFLPTLSRCCYACLLDHEDYELAPAHDLVNEYIIPKEYRQKLVFLTSLPNDYGTYKYYTHDEPYIMASVQAVVDLSLGIHGTRENVRKRKAEYARAALEKFNEDRKILISWHSARLLGNFPRPPTPVRAGCMNYKLFDKETLAKWRFMASTAFPYWNVAEQKLETGTYCSACTKEWEDQEEPPEVRAGGIAEHRYHKAFLEEELPAHFRQCRATRMGLVRENRTLERFPLKRSGENFLVEFDEHGPGFDINCLGDDN